MRRLILLLILLLSLISYGFMGSNTTGHYALPAAGEFCDSDTADIACEDWDAAASPNNERLVWVQDTDSGAGGTIDIDAAPNAPFACGGTYAIDFLLDNDTAGDCYTYYNMTDFAADTIYYIYFQFKLVDDGAMANGSTCIIMTADVSTDPVGTFPAQVIFAKTSSGTDYEIRAQVSDDGSVLNVIDVNTVIVLDTVYEVMIKWEQLTGADNDIFEFFVDGVSQGDAFVINGADDIVALPTYVSLGTSTVYAGNYSANFQINNFQIKTATVPGDCTE